MIAVDSNILVYAHRRESQHGETGFQLLKTLAEGSQPWAIPWPCCYEFLSVVTNRQIWKGGATTPQQAWQQMVAWTNSPSNRMIGETASFPEILQAFVNHPRIMGGIVHDARIAAICVAHGVEKLLTRDRDFSVFSQLRTQDPFAK